MRYQEDKKWLVGKRGYKKNKEVPDIVETQCIVESICGGKRKERGKEKFRKSGRIMKLYGNGLISYFPKGYGFWEGQLQYLVKDGLLPEVLKQWK